MTPQHRQILDLHADGKFHCSTEIEYIRDQRKRISELRQMGHEFISEPCARYCGKAHNSRLFMRKLILKERKEVYKQSFLDSQERERAYQKLGI